MVDKASSKTSSSKDSTTTIGFGATASCNSAAILRARSLGKDNFRKDDDVRWQQRQIAKGNPQGERGSVHESGMPIKHSHRDSANLLSDGKPQSVSEARADHANFAWGSAGNTLNLSSHEFRNYERI